MLFETIFLLTFIITDYLQFYLLVCQNIIRSNYETRFTNLPRPETFPAWFGLHSIFQLVKDSLFCKTLKLSFNR